MKLQAMTTEDAMRKLAQFIDSTPANKVAYARRRVSLINGPDMSAFPDETILGLLQENESLMGRFVQQFEAKKSSVTTGLVLDEKLLDLSNEFVNVAVVAGIDSLLKALQPGNNEVPHALVSAIDKLFVDRDYLRNKLEHFRTLIGKRELVSEVIYTDARTYNNIFLPITDPGPSEAKEAYGLAFASFMGVDLCMLINARCLEVNEIYTPKVMGFAHEFYLYTLLHELTHLLLDSDDLAYGYAQDDEVEDYDVYSMRNLKATDISNADNYCTLIFIALAQLHKERRIDLSRY